MSLGDVTSGDVYLRILDAIASLRAESAKRFMANLGRARAEPAVDFWVRSGIVAACAGSNALGAIVGPLEQDDALAVVRERIGWPLLSSVEVCQDFGKLNSDFYDVVCTCPPRDVLIARAILSIRPKQLEEASCGESASPVVVEVGCGTGVIPRVLRRIGFTFPIDVVDVSSGVVERCREYGLPRVRVFQSDASQFVSDCTYDAAIAFLLHHHLPDAGPSLHGLSDMLRVNAVMSYTDKFVIEGTDDTVQSRDSYGMRGVRDTIVAAGHASELVISRCCKGILTRPHPVQYAEHVRGLGSGVMSLAREGLVAEHTTWYQPFLFQFTCRKRCV